MKALVRKLRNPILRVDVVDRLTRLTEVEVRLKPGGEEWQFSGASG